MSDTGDQNQDILGRHAPAGRRNVPIGAKSNVEGRSRQDPPNLMIMIMIMIMCQSILINDHDDNQN